MEDSNDYKQIFPGKVIGNKFKLEDKIGQGTFGIIYKCLHTETQESCALKLEKRNSKHSSMLVREIKVMMEVKSEKGFARLIGYGKDEDYNYVAMTYLGRNLDSLIKKCGGKFSLPTTINVFQQCLQRLETLHSKNLIHRDIKPDNFVIGYAQNYNIVHLIDFGLAKYYIDSEGGMIGTARYASVGAHMGYEQSRRDDLEGLGYVILYCAKGKVPWQQIYTETKEEKYEKIKLMKKSLTLEVLCDGLPIQFVEYFQYIKTLEFTDKPNYQLLNQMILKMADKYKKEEILRVDWELLPEYRNKKNQKNKTNGRDQERRPTNLLLIPGMNEDKVSQQPSVCTAVDNTSRQIQMASNLSNLGNNGINISYSNFMNGEEYKENFDEKQQDDDKTHPTIYLENTNIKINVMIIKKSYKND